MCSSNERASVGDYRYRLSLWVEHADADLSGVSAALGIKPKHLWKKGDPRITPNGRVIDGVRKNSYCSVDLDEGHDDLPGALRRAADLLLPHKDYLLRLHDAGTELRLFIGWFSDFNSRDVLDWSLLRDLAELRITLDFDFYGPDAQPTSSNVPNSGA